MVAVDEFAFVQVKLADMLDTVDPRCGWEVDFIGYLADPSKDLEGSIKSGGKLLRRAALHAGLPIGVEAKVDKVPHVKSLLLSVSIFLFLHPLLGSPQMEL
ncbi:hypothetical protein Scep_019497 [Stephania cephalantha]|uniref:Uncharacterized protein n=1 Tax=Stephania cephalantha TaxID=152367 RepID=A0AAP0IBB5_9MAGN